MSIAPQETNSHNGACSLLSSRQHQHSNNTHQPCLSDGLATHRHKDKHARTHTKDRWLTDNNLLSTNTTLFVVIDKLAGPNWDTNTGQRHYTPLDSSREIPHVTFYSIVLFYIRTYKR